MKNHPYHEQKERDRLMQTNQRDQPLNNGKD